MGLSADQIRRIAHLAKLELDSEEEALYGQQLAQVVDYIDQLKAFSTSPSRPGVPGEDSQVTILDPSSEGADHAQPRREVAWALDNAPQSLGCFFVVPQIKASEGG